MPFRRLLLVLLCLPLLLSAAPEDYFGIHVIDESTGRGVPLITLTTTNHIALTTDRRGLDRLQ